MEKLKKVIINSDLNIKQVLKHMDDASEKTLFVIDNKDRFLGSVTDGDIRRWILKGESLAESISRVMNTNPIFLKEGYSKKKLKV